MRLSSQSADLSQKILLLRVEVLRHDDLDDHELVAPPAASNLGHASSAQLEGLAVLSAGRDRHLDQAVERGDLDSVSKRGLDHVDLQFEDDILVLPLKQGMRPNSDHDIKIARTAVLQP